MAVSIVIKFSARWTQHEQLQLWSFFIQMEKEFKIAKVNSAILNH